MRKNNGTETKNITLVIPEATELLEVVYYWKMADGRLTKTTCVLTEDGLEDGAVKDCYDFEEGKDEE